MAALHSHLAWVCNSQQQPYLKPVIRCKGAGVSCWDLFLLCLQLLLFQVLYQALHTLCKSAHPAAQHSALSLSYAAVSSQIC